jgi:hypothetical protein
MRLPWLLRNRDKTLIGGLFQGSPRRYRSSLVVGKSLETKETRGVCVELTLRGSPMEGSVVPKASAKPSNKDSCSARCTARFTKLRVVSRKNNRQISILQSKAPQSFAWPKVREDGRAKGLHYLELGHEHF